MKKKNILLVLGLVLISSLISTKVLSDDVPFDFIAGDDPIAWGYYLQGKSYSSGKNCCVCVWGPGYSCLVSFQCCDNWDPETSGICDLTNCGFN